MMETDEISCNRLRAEAKEQLSQFLP